MKDVLDPLEVGPGAPFGFERVTFAELAWATAAVSSRAFTNLYGGWRQEEKPLLVPFLDMVNFNLEESNVKVGGGFFCHFSLLDEGAICRSVRTEVVGGLVVVEKEAFFRAELQRKCAGVGDETYRPCFNADWLP